MNRNKPPWINALLIGSCCVLCIVLLMLFYSNRQDEERLIQEIRAEAAEEQKSSDTEEISGEEPEGEEKKETETEAVEDDKQQNASTDEAPSEVQGISFRGDSFCDEEEISETGLGVYMMQVLKEQGKELPVQDYTLFEAGSMTHMKLAGVDSEILDDYLKVHKKLAKEQTLRITEVKIRELTDEQMIRTDQDYIPVLCVGYYGGWTGDLEELCEQQQRILDTYQQKDKYLILGIYPAAFSDKKLYRETMEEYWGEHFVCVDDLLYHSITSDKGKKETAQIVYDKLAELGYIG